MGKPAFINRSINKIGRWLVRQKTELFLNENIDVVEKKEKSLNVNGEICHVCIKKSSGGGQKIVKNITTD